MNRLNKSQIEYARARVNQISNKKKEDLKKFLTTGQALTDERRAILLKQGKVKLKKGITKVRGYSDVRDVFDFTPFEQKTDAKKYSAGVKKIENNALSLIDKLMLGDTEQALKLISGLEDIK